MHKKNMKWFLLGALNKLNVYTSSQINTIAYSVYVGMLRCRGMCACGYYGYMQVREFKYISWRRGRIPILASLYYVFLKKTENSCITMLTV